MSAGVLVLHTAMTPDLYGGRVATTIDAKYMAWTSGKRLSSWARRALPVAIEL